MSTAVLVVDDDPDCCEIIARWLTAAGFDVWTAPGGPEALATLRQMAQPPAAIVSDVLMPILDGVALLREVRKTFPAMPFIFLSGTLGDIPRELLEARSSDRLACLWKPCDRRDLLDAIQQMLDPTTPAPPPPLQGSAVVGEVAGGVACRCKAPWGRRSRFLVGWKRELEGRAPAP